MSDKPQFDFDPGLTVRVPISYATPLSTDAVALGGMVRLTEGVFRGFIGHVHDIETIAEKRNLIVRQGTPDLWEGR